MGKTRDLFKKIRDNKETFHAKMGSTKDRNGMDLLNLFILHLICNILLHNNNLIFQRVFKSLLKSFKE